MRVLVAGLVLVIGCSKEESKPTPGASDNDGGTLVAEAQTFVEALCSVYAACCDDGTADACAASVAAQASGAAFDAARAETCLASVREKSRITLCLEAPTPTCAAVFKLNKAKAPGKSCTEARDCSNGDDGDGLCIVGTCRRASTGKEGDRCIGTLVDGKIEPLAVIEVPAGALCHARDGLYCDEESKTCKPRGNIGAKCVGLDVSCVDEAWCPTTTGECVRRTPFRGACEDAYECTLGSQCANDGEGGAACIEFADVGASCERGDECNAKQGLTCDTETTQCAKDKSRFADACKAKLALALP